MRRRSRGALFVVIATVVGYLVLPTAAGAAEFETFVTCTSVSGVCSEASTNPDPPAGAGNVDFTLAGGTQEGQIFIIEPTGGATVDSIEVTYNDGDVETPDLRSDNTYVIPATAERFVTRFEVNWTGAVATTTTSSTSTSSTSSTSTSTSSTTTTTVLTRGPGNGPQSISPDAVTQSSPDAAAVRGIERVDVVVASEGAVHWTRQENAGAWAPYTSLGKPGSGIKGDPTIVSWGPGRLDVFARGSDDRLWQTYSENGGSTWSGWLKPFGEDGTLASGPDASSRGPNRLNVFVLGTNGAVHERFYEPTGWSSIWLNHGAPAAGVPTEAAGGRDPSAVSWGESERIDVFIRGGDSKLWQANWNGLTWSGWSKPVGDDGPGDAKTVASSPDAASWEPGNLLVFVRGADNRLYVVPFGGSWGTYIRLVRPTDTWKDGPGATSRGADRFDVFVRGTDDLTYHVWQ